VSAHKKEVLLLARRVKTDSTRHNLLENPTIDTPMQQTSCWYRDGFPKQAASLHYHLRTSNAFWKSLFASCLSPSSTNSTPKHFKQRKTTTYDDIRFIHSLDNLDKRKQIMNVYLERLKEREREKGTPEERLKNLHNKLLIFCIHWHSKCPDNGCACVYRSLSFMDAVRTNGSAKHTLLHAKLPCLKILNVEKAKTEQYNLHTFNRSISTNFTFLVVLEETLLFLKL
ncbi:hypothetical protein H5410_050684, partial [Solanum commersonii]